MNQVAKKLQEIYGYDDDTAIAAARNLCGFFEVLQSVEERQRKEREAGAVEGTHGLKGNNNLEDIKI